MAHGLFRRLPIAAVLTLSLAASHASASAAQRDPRTALLETAAWDALSAGDAQTAAGHFRAALDGDPRNARRFGRLNGAQAQLAYATSALAVRRLLDEAGGAAVANLLRDLGGGVDFEGAFLHRIQRTFTTWVIA